MAPLDRFSPAAAAWFRDSFDAPTAAQSLGWEAIAAGSHTLIHAPTGSGKTLAAFLWAIDGLLTSPMPDEARRCRVVYVSPLKALAYDIERNLRAPLRGIRRTAGLEGTEVADLSVALRTGDTPADERRRMLRHPPDILITTPESLYLMVTSQARQVLAPVATVIVDEIHSVAGSKRGSHLTLTLERLDEIAERPPQRIGLSATQRPLEAIAEFLGGGVPTAEGWQPRPVAIVDAPRDKELDVEIVVPVEDMTRPGGVDDQGNPVRSIWPSIYPRIAELVARHRSTIVFANSRGLVERLAAALNEEAGDEIARAHHGSVSRDQRLDIEDGLKRGTLRCVVATSSLELGIDMEAVDLVVLVESPTTVARGLQRVGRAGHQVGAPSRAKVYPKHRGDLLEAAVIVDRMQRGLIEETRVPRNPLDVLAQQIVAMVSMDECDVDDVYDLVRRAAPYRSLARGPFDAVLDMLSGRYPSDEFAELRPRLTWDRVSGRLSARPGAHMLAVTNPGTIPDRGLYSVTLPEGGRVGELDEEMVYESRVGDAFVLGSSTWQITDITPDRVLVVPAPGRPAARMPFWYGDTLGRPVETGQAIGAFVRQVAAEPPAEAETLLRERFRLDEHAAANLVRYIAEERAATGTVPSDRTLVAQRFRDEIGDWRVVLLSPFGSRVHAPWALAVAAVLRRSRGVEVDTIWSDDGFILRFPDADEPPDLAVLALDPDEVESLVVDEAGTSALFAARFREAAARSLLLPRRRPGSRTPLWLQRRRAGSLLEAARRHPDFPVVLESMREVLQEHFDLPALRDLLDALAARRIRLSQIQTHGPSPFASSLMFDFIASYMYEYDAPAAERRAMALTIDRELLGQLLGEPSLRELLDPEVISSVELELQRLADGTGVTGPDAIVDLLRALGPLDTEGIRARSGEPKDVPGILADLERDRRIIEISVGGSPRWAVIEDAARLRDALGVQPPRGVPEALLEPVADPLGDVIGRHARTHTPFTTTEAAAALGLPVAVVDETLRRLERAGRVASGAFRPDGGTTEWVDSGVLRRLRRRSLAVLRSEVEAVDPFTLGGFLPEWHGIGAGGSTPGRLLEVVDRLQGAAIPASILERDVLAGRLDYTPDLLDGLLASGEVVWIGRGPLAGRDGRVALYRREQAALLHWPLDASTPDGPIHDAVRRHLAQHGASFFTDLYRAAGGGDPRSVVEAMWDLAWAGEITNDTVAPLRAYLWGKARRRTGRPSLPAASTPAQASGRWSLVGTLLHSSTPTEHQTARARQMLERHGVVVRQAVLAEGVPGGFAGLYPVFSALEEAGRIRRGYFVEGLGGAQFALPGAVDRLRTSPSGSSVLAAADPANPFGAAMPWPESAGRPSRSAGAYVVVVAGAPAAFVERGARTVTTFGGEASPEAVAAAIVELGRVRLGRVTIESVDGDPVGATPLGAALTDRGFSVGYRGLTLDRR